MAVIDYGWTDKIVCPYCGHTDQYSWEWSPDGDHGPEGDGESECEMCCKKFSVNCTVIYRYTSRKLL